MYAKKYATATNQVGVNIEKYSPSLQVLGYQLIRAISITY